MNNNNNEKYYIYEINFKNTKGLEPISVEFSTSHPLHGLGKFDVVFTKEGAQRNPYLYAVKEGSTQPAQPVKPVKE